jgi:glutaredoxin/predicted outer membrane lipoprotein
MMKDRLHHVGNRFVQRLLPGLLLACAFAHIPAAAQMYKWTDAQGTVHYTDTPPPQQRASQINTPSAGAAQASLPYELARAVKANPVTLYTTAQSACAGCDQGRSLLRARGIPYTEKTVNTDEDKEQLRHLAGKLELPLLVVGSRTVAGFQDAAWQDALSAAAYPRSAQLPSGYQYAAPEPAAPASVPTPPARAKNAPPPNAAAVQAAEQQPRRPAARDTTPAKPPTGNAPPGFQF